MNKLGLTEMMVAVTLCILLPIMGYFYYRSPTISAVSFVIVVVACTAISLVFNYNTKNIVELLTVLFSVSTSCLLGWELGDLLLGKAENIGNVHAAIFNMTLAGLSLICFLLIKPPEK